MKIKYAWGLVALLLSTHQMYPQGLQIEPLVGHNGFYYQHLIGTPLGDHTGFGMLNISSASARYSNSLPAELMSQLYLTHQVWKYLSVGAGMIYVTAVGMRPTAMGQMVRVYKELSLVIFPRVDLWKNPSMELMTVIEYRPQIASTFALYSRIQLQTIWNKYNHLKSSQHLRLGLETGDIRFGLAVVLEEYGSGFSTYQNYGLFIRKEIKNVPPKTR